jgi:LmbE family N-acetylglucosaminyl deacetylase
LRAAPTGNCARFAAAPLSGGGTTAHAWLPDLDAQDLPTLDLGACPGLVIVAPHPDDETLGLGAMAAQLVASGVDVQVVSVSDGDAAVPGAPRSERDLLACTRRGELLEATAVLGVDPPRPLGLPDGQLTEHEDRLTDSLTGILDGVAPGSWCAATWRGDGHPDHEAVGRAAALACAATGTTLIEYPIWMWHWAGPSDPAVPWQRAFRVPMPGWARDRKHLAAQRFRSQFEAGADGSGPVLPPDVLQRLLAVGEVVFR